MSNKYDSQAVLGRKYRDNITDIEGTAVVTSFHLHACEQVTLERVHDGKSSFHTVDVARLIDVETGAQLDATGTKQSKKSKKKAKKQNGSTARHVASTRHEGIN